MTDDQRELRTTSDLLIQDLEVLLALEQEKRDLPADDERMVALATRVDEIAARVFQYTQAERELAVPVHVAAHRGLTPATTIEETPPRPIAAILADWRAAERAAQDAAEGSPERMEAEMRIESMRAEYRRSYETITSDRGRSRPTASG